MFKFDEFRTYRGRDNSAFIIFPFSEYSFPPINLVESELFADDEVYLT